MSDKSRPDANPFSVINRGHINAAWDGTPTTLLPNESALMEVTPNGSVVLSYQNQSVQGEHGTLAVTSGGSAPSFLPVPGLAEQPLILVNNWRGNYLSLTNITPPAVQVPILVQLIGPGLPGLTPLKLPADGTPVPLGSGQAAQGTTPARLMQVILQAESGNMLVFAILGGPPDASGNNAYVIALNATQETGPGTNNPPPAGYYATTVGAVYTYQLNWGGASIFIVNSASEAGGGRGVVSLRPL